ncbi:MAG: signal peptidase II [Spirochaetae bacterium HGW-Spirochaetae-3]|jgi:signal peptidase II|nr:MAG: signal peptidase II [Spirochaetae bacterium HGW-Spirochaetae-3]
MPEKKNKKPLAPFALTLAILVADQVTKAAVVASIRPGRIAWNALGDFFWLVHQKNTGAAFSMGDGLAEPLRVAILIVVPLALMIALCVYYFKTDELTPVQRWALCGIIGGGVGNIIDRIARPEGVVDFLSFKFYGLFGLERWPTFNVADSAVVLCGVLLVVAGFFIPSPDGGTPGKPKA